MTLDVYIERLEFLRRHHGGELEMVTSFQSYVSGPASPDLRYTRGEGSQRYFALPKEKWEYDSCEKVVLV